MLGFHVIARDKEITIFSSGIVLYEYLTYISTFIFSIAVWGTEEVLDGKPSPSRVPSSYDRILLSVIIMEASEHQALVLESW